MGLAGPTQSPAPAWKQQGGPLAGHVAPLVSESGWRIAVCTTNCRLGMGGVLALPGAPGARFYGWIRGRLRRRGRQVHALLTSSRAGVPLCYFFDHGVWSRPDGDLGDCVQRRIPEQVLDGAS